MRCQASIKTVSAATLDDICRGSSETSSRKYPSYQDRIAMATTKLYNLVSRSNVANSSDSAVPSDHGHLTELQLTSSPISMDDILTQVKRLEKRTFPKAEAMDFDIELQKRNTELIIVLDCSPPEEAVNFTISEANRQAPKSLLPTDSASLDQSVSKAVQSSASDIYSSQVKEALVVAYILHARSAGASLLHKVCVAEKYRRQGIAKQLLTIFKTKLETQGCERIQLWVDWQRDGAIKLYTSVGFRRTDAARDYYGAGRHGVKMAVDLTWVW